MHKNTLKLRALMRKSQMKAVDVAEIVKREPGTVAVWRCKSDNRVIPDELLQLLVLTVAARAK